MIQPREDSATTEAGAPTLVVVCGLPATGKSSLAELLRIELGWPLFAKDWLKEMLYDAVDRTGQPFARADSSEIGKQSLAVLFAACREVLACGVNCIIEANLLPDHAPADLAPLLDIAQGRQVHCAIPDSLVLERYRARAARGERHPVHQDSNAEQDLIDRIADGGGQPLPIPTTLLRVDTTDGFRPELGEIVAFCRS